MKRIILVFSLLVLSLPAISEAKVVKSPGFIQDTATSFKIGDSAWKNVTITTSAKTELKAESLPNTLILKFSPVNSKPTINVSIYGLDANTKYFKYTDSYANLEYLTSDTAGKINFTLDNLASHLVFIQTKKSTRFINDDSTGGNCVSIGSWNNLTKTCILNTDLTETVQINGSGITLDGAGHLITGFGTGSGVFVNGMNNIRLKNLEVKNFSIGIFFSNGSGGRIESVHSHHNFKGLELDLYNSVIVKGNNLSNNMLPGGLFAGDPRGLELDTSNLAIILNNTIAGNGVGVRIVRANDNTFNRNTIAGNGVLGVSTLGGDRNVFYQNNFLNNANQVDTTFDADISFNKLITEGAGNFWSNHICTPRVGDPNICQESYLVDGRGIFSDIVDQYPWVAQDQWLNPVQPPPPPSGGGTSASNVAFIPGLEASRLYKRGFLTEDKLWEPNNNSDVESLFLDVTGSSISSGIYTRDVVDEAFGFFNIYKKFIQYMNGLVTSSVIEKWEALPYDWRLSVDGVADNSVQLENATYLMIDKIDELARTSKTGKVTIVAHSNGGHIAKLLINKLADLGKAGLVDKLILVASPQLGTPSAVGALLHGYDQEIPPSMGFIMNKLTARKLAENMPSLYTLLPSPRYFTLAPSNIIQFDSSLSSVTNKKSWQSFYGTDVNSYNELDNFFKASDGRTDPSDSDLLTPNLSNNQLLNNGKVLQGVLDNWTPPAGIEVSQVVGWGLDTLAGIRYFAQDKYDCNLPQPDPSKPCHVSEIIVDVKPVFTKDGDQTVIIGSARGASVGNTYYMNIKNHNKELLLNLRRNRKHPDIMEIASIQELIKGIIQSSISSLPTNISSTKPSFEAGDISLQLEFHSPVKVDIYDTFGNHTGLINGSSDLKSVEEQIPNSYYIEFGEGKYIGLNADDEYRVSLQGTDNGVLTMVVKELVGDQIISTSYFNNVPITLTTKGVITASDIVGLTSDLLIDANGDGIFEKIIKPSVTQITSTTSTTAPLTMEIKPETINLRSNGIITVFLSGGDIGQLDKSSLRLEGATPERILEANKKVILKFRVQDLTGIDPTDISFVLTGKKLDGETITLSDVVKIIAPGNRNKQK